MKLSQGWSILVGASVSALLYNIVIFLVVRFVPGVRIALPLAVIAAPVSGVVAAALASTFSLYGARGAAIASGFLSPFLSAATGLGRVFAASFTWSNIASYVFFAITLLLSLGGAYAFSLARNRKWRGPGPSGLRGRHLRRVK